MSDCDINDSNITLFKFYDYVNGLVQIEKAKYLEKLVKVNYNRNELLQLKHCILRLLLQHRINVFHFQLCFYIPNNTNPNNEILVNSSFGLMLQMSTQEKTAKSFL